MRNKKAHLYEDGLFLYKNKKSFSLIEIIFTIVLISVLFSYIVPKNGISKIKIAKQQLITHLKYTRYIAMLDNKYNINDIYWHKKLWNIKFLNCNESNGGIYYVIYSNEINPSKWYISKDETLIDPFTNNYIYSTSKCEQDSLYDKSKYVLLSSYYGIDKILISCNDTSSLGQIYFDNNGSGYSYINNNYDYFKEYMITDNCIIKLYDKNNNEENITIEGNTGYIY
jgi:type II secretory pathway pseudopilin PulG